MPAETEPTPIETHLLAASSKSFFPSCPLPVPFPESCFRSGLSRGSPERSEAAGNGAHREAIAETIRKDEAASVAVQLWGFDPCAKVSETSPPRSRDRSSAVKAKDEPHVASSAIGAQGSRRPISGRRQLQLWIIHAPRLEGWLSIVGKIMKPTPVVEDRVGRRAREVWGSRCGRAARSCTTDRSQPRGLRARSRIHRPRFPAMRREDHGTARSSTSDSDWPGIRGVEYVRIPWGGCRRKRRRNSVAQRVITRRLDLCA